MRPYEPDPRALPPAPPPPITPPPQVGPQTGAIDQVRDALGASQAQEQAESFNHRATSIAVVQTFHRASQINLKRAEHLMAGMMQMSAGSQRLDHERGDVRVIEPASNGRNTQQYASSSSTAPPASPPPLAPPPQDVSQHAATGQVQDEVYTSSAEKHGGAARIPATRHA